MDKTPDRCCQRCHLPLAPEEQEHSDGFVLSKHTEAVCISRLLDELTAMRSAESVEMGRLRQRISEMEVDAEVHSTACAKMTEALQISGTVARMEEWLRRPEDPRSVEFCMVLPERKILCMVDSPIGTFEASADTVRDALNAALDQADGV